MELALLAVLIIGIAVGAAWQRFGGWRLRRFIREMEKLSIQRLTPERKGA
jgi:hypothetical protein